MPILIRVLTNNFKSYCYCLKLHQLFLTLTTSIMWNKLILYFRHWAEPWMYWFYNAFFFCLLSPFEAVKMFLFSTLMIVSGSKVNADLTLGRSKVKKFQYFSY